MRSINSDPYQDWWFFLDSSGGYMLSPGGGAPGDFFMVLLLVTSKVPLQCNRSFPSDHDPKLLLRHVPQPQQTV